MKLGCVLNLVKEITVRVQLFGGLGFIALCVAAWFFFDTAEEASTKDASLTTPSATLEFPRGQCISDSNLPCVDGSIKSASLIINVSTDYSESSEFLKTLSKQSTDEIYSRIDSIRACSSSTTVCLPLNVMAEPLLAELKKRALTGDLDASTSIASVILSDSVVRHPFIHSALRSVVPELGNLSVDSTVEYAHNKLREAAAAGNGRAAAELARIEAGILAFEQMKKDFGGDLSTSLPMQAPGLAQR